jgi:catechol 2,3-dioxygenase-like lactoylglutathione lyase family enzyme
MATKKRAKVTKRATRTQAGRTKTKKRAAAKNDAGLTFNHAMLYSQDVARALRFYVEGLGFKPVDDVQYEGRIVYARIRAPRGDSTIAIHRLEQGKFVPPDEGVRLYFEVKNLEPFCKKLEAAGIALSKPPKMMPWGWTHAYLDDPDGHEVSLYWAGAKRLQKTAR